MLKTFIVDDEYEIMEEIRELVNGTQGLEVSGCFTNPSEALEAARIQAPDCALVDIQMPGISGLDLADALLQLNPRTDVIFITAFNQYAVSAFEVGAIDYILKPVHPLRFQKAVTRVLQGQQNSQNQQQGELQIRTFGHPGLLLEGEIVRWSRSKSKEVFFYLLCHRNNRKHKFILCEELWPESDPQKALISLQTAVYGLRKTLAALKDRQIIIDYSDDCYEMRTGNVRWDYMEFMDAAERYHKDRTIQIEQILELYSGTFLEGEDWPWADAFRSEASSRYQQLCEMLLSEVMIQQNWPKAINLCQKILKEQPFNGRIQRSLAEAYLKEYGDIAVQAFFSRMRQNYHLEYDLELDKQIYDFLKEHNIILME